ncbi:MAG: hypothetical protein KU37_11985 [Sulfuricurvum sp. PC08-66]|nr:MAG: hypothetical protein KU37_11985 [Sulfuricurvum sp. PC08-66]
MRAVALLRGINVGGKNSLKMEALKTMCESIGFEQVSTYINSGNVIFETTMALDEASSILREAIAKHFVLEIPTLVLSMETIASALAHNPFDPATHNPSYILFYFLFDTPQSASLDIRHATMGEEVRRLGNVVYIYYPEGSGRSKLDVRIDGKKLSLVSTSRNVTTVEKLRNLMEKE